MTNTGHMGERHRQYVRPIADKAMVRLASFDSPPALASTPVRGRGVGEGGAQRAKRRPHNPSRPLGSGETFATTDTAHFF